MTTPASKFFIARYFDFRGDPKLVTETNHVPDGFTQRHEFEPGGKTAIVTLTSTDRESRSTYHYDPLTRQIEHLLTQSNGYTSRAVTKLDQRGRKLQTEVYTVPGGELGQRNLVERGPTWRRRTQHNKFGIEYEIHEELDALGRCVKTTTKGRRHPKSTIAHYTHDQFGNTATEIRFGPRGTISRGTYEREYDNNGNWTLEKRYEWNRADNSYELKSTLTREIEYF